MFADFIGTGNKLSKIRVGHRMLVDPEIINRDLVRRLLVSLTSRQVASHG